MTLTARPEGRSGLLAVYSARARVGYLMPRADGDWLWEVNLASEQWRGHPRGVASSREEALARCEEILAQWARVAGFVQEAR